MMLRSRVRFFLAACLAFTPLALRGAATITIVNADPPGIGFNDPTPVAPLGGNTGTTLGQQRLNAFQAAANKWGATLSSPVTIRIRAVWTALTCTPTSGVLGSAGATEVWRDFNNAPVANHWYGKAQANALSGSDLDSTTADISANFNINLGNPGCLSGIHFYLGLDDNHGSNIDLVTVLTHEFAHGLGFLTFTSGQTGAQFSGSPSIWDDFLLDNTTNKTWTLMSDAERAASALNSRHLVWNGGNVTSAIPQVLQPQGSSFMGADALGRGLMYAPNPYQSGSSISHWDTSMFPNQLMEPVYNSDLTHEVTPPQDLTFPLLKDIGWSVGSGPLPAFTIVKTHTGNFTQGQMGATYTITVANSASGATSGTVTVTDTVPLGLTATAMSGPGWTCSQPSGPCTRSDSLAAGASYPPITLTVNVAVNAPATVTNTAAVSGGGAVNTSTASDVTSIGSGSPPPAGTDLALGQSATQSSTLPGSPTAVAASAVDGNTDGNFYDGSVTATNLETNAWWQVDLGTSATVNSIVIWNRTDCCSNRLSDYWVFVSNTPFSPTDTPSTLQNRVGTFSSHQTAAPNPSTTIAAGGAQGRYVRVQLTGTNYLSLAEVQVFGTGGLVASNLAQPGVYRNGAWFVDWNGNNQWDATDAAHVFFFGLPGDLPVMGDWNGDGRLKVGVYRNGAWYVDWNGNNQWDATDAAHVFYFGLPGDLPVMGDWNGDGRLKAGVYRKGAWFVDWNGNNQWDATDAAHVFLFGLPGDLPVMAHWDSSQPGVSSLQAPTTVSQLEAALTTDRPPRQFDIPRYVLEENEELRTAVEKMERERNAILLDPELRRQLFDMQRDVAEIESRPEVHYLSLAEVQVIGQ